ncbi:MAG: Holliday junction branch migration protein RuvA [Candidatus Pacebacteria bacterium]|nr:Holliday junction branch migration protein RuvA [Candidatus Paceibacterota bacterium]MBP9851141.1 Holliday junction branch migration protein RuvA [Candidatus Paceibacterota bacterium]
MIGSIRGKVTLKGDRFVLVETAGVGYKIWTSQDNLSKVKNDAEVLFYTHTHVREDSLDLYGFLNYEELDFFEMLINVSGIGPKGALTILSVATIETLQRAISTSDIPYLTKISGIGKKTAEKMVIELRDKVGVLEKNETLKDELDALLALQALGYSQNEARDALKGLSPELSTNAKIKEALKVLGGK